MAAEAGVELVGSSASQEIGVIPVSVTDWATLFIEAQRCTEEGFPTEYQDLGGDTWTRYGVGLPPYWVLVAGDVVVALQKQYLPWWAGPRALGCGSKPPPS